MLDKTGKTVWQSELGPWGNLLKEQNQDNLYQPIRMPGQHYDEESGLHYNRHRYYDSKTGRYISQDPIGLTGGINLYHYPLNPMQYVDYIGLSYADEWAVAGAAGGAVVGGTLTAAGLE